MRGQLIWFNHEKQHGFIRTEDGERLLVEQSGFEPGTVIADRCGGTPLVFEREEANSVSRAVRVSIETAGVPRRARLRHR
jgi:cold shock CspA family protein